MPILGIIGTGGFAREVMPIARDRFRAVHGPTAQVAFVQSVPTSDKCNGLPVISTSDFLSQRGTELYFNVAIASCESRARLADELTDGGAQPFSVIAPSAELYGPNQLATGAILCAFTTVTSNVTVGKFFQANLYSYVGHDCVIGDFVTFAPRVCCNGNVRVGDGAYIGTNATIRQGTPDQPLIIGERAVVGMGAVVTRNVAAEEVVIGNPARPMRRD